MKTRTRLIILISSLLLIVISVTVIIVLNQKDDLKRYIAPGTVVDSFEPSIQADYPIPENGRAIIDEQVRRAIKAYAGQDVTFFLGIIVIINNTKLENYSAYMTEELERLTELGYHVGYSQRWSFQGSGENIKKVYQAYVAGYFTAEELESFPAEYGYEFFFARNGNGTPVSYEQGIICDFESRAR